MLGSGAGRPWASWLQSAGAAITCKKKKTGTFIYNNLSKRSKPRTKKTIARKRPRKKREKKCDITSTIKNKSIFSK